MAISKMVLLNHLKNFNQVDKYVALQRDCAKSAKIVYPHHRCSTEDLTKLPTFTATTGRAPIL